MAKRNALVRRLSSVETLGETTVICTDKTGTLTENEMTVERVWSPEHGWFEVEGAGYEPFGRFHQNGRVADPRPLRELLRCALLCNDARLTTGPAGVEIVGDPTEAALVVVAEKGGLRHEHEAARRPRVAEIPFDSDRKRMSTVHLVGDRRVAYVKGAADVLVPRTTLRRTSRRPLSPRPRRWSAPRCACSPSLGAFFQATPSRPDDLERELEFLGVAGMLDPPRPEVSEAIASCRAAGIRVIMVTGDSGYTAEAVARTDRSRPGRERT